MDKRQRRHSHHKPLVSHHVQDTRESMISNFETLRALVEQVANFSKIVESLDEPGSRPLRTKLNGQISKLKKEIAKLVDHTEALANSYDQLVLGQLLNIQTTTLPPILPRGLRKKDEPVPVRVAQPIAVPVIHVIKSQDPAWDIGQLAESVLYKRHIRQSARAWFGEHKLVVKNIKIQKGSIEICYMVSASLEWIQEHWVAVGASTYVAVSQYKDFKNGVSELRQDVKRSAKAFEKKLIPITRLLGYKHAQRLLSGKAAAPKETGKAEPKARAK